MRADWPTACLYTTGILSAASLFMNRVDASLAKDFVRFLVLEDAGSAHYLDFAGDLFITAADAEAARLLLLPGSIPATRTTWPR